MLFDRESDEEPASPRLQLVQPAYLVPEPTEQDPTPRELSVDSRRPFNPQTDPGLRVLLGPGYTASHIEALDSPSESVSYGSPAMTDQGGVSQATPADESLSEPDTSIDSRLVDPKALGAQAAAALATEATSEPRGEPREPAKRVDSAQDNELPQATSFKPPVQSERATPLKLQTGAPIPGSDDTITTSPRLARHTIPVEEGNAGTLPALQPTSPTASGIPTSPQSERLPSFRQLTQLADAATQQDIRAPQYSRHHSQSFGSATAPSPVLPYHIPPNPQMSPNSQYAFSARSPASTMGDHYSSPTQYAGNPYYMDRRTSAIHDHAVGMPPSLPSASSSGESHGPSTDGYSTSHTTPIDSGAIFPDGAQRNMPILPPPRGMPQTATMMIGGFKCEWPGCDAPPFATQYLLRYESVITKSWVS